MQLFNMLRNYEETLYLAHKFPDMVKFSKKVSVIPWEEGFAESEKSENYFMITRLNYLLNQKKIKYEYYLSCLNELIKSNSHTLAIAFMDNNSVSFRYPDPPFELILHELAHLYFRVDDLLLSDKYMGSEILIKLGLKKFNITEENIRNYHEIVNLTLRAPTVAHRKITDIVSPALGLYKHLAAIAYYCGIILNSDIVRLNMNPKSNKGWRKIKITQHEILRFLQNIIAGLIYSDVYPIKIAQLLGFIQ